MTDDTPSLAERRPQLVRSRSLYEGQVIALRVDTLRLPNGQEVEREIINHPGAVVVAAVDAQGRVAIVEQYRHAVGHELKEIPAGTLEEGEDPFAAAVRELQEEAGLQARRWDALGHFYSSPGFLREKMYAYLAQDLHQVPVNPDDDEDIELEWVSLEEATWGQEHLTDAKSLAVLLLVQAFLEREQDKG